MGGLNVSTTTSVLARCAVALAPWNQLAATPIRRLAALMWVTHSIGRALSRLIPAPGGSHPRPGQGNSITIPIN